MLKSFSGFVIIGALAAMVNVLTRAVLNIWVSFEAAIVLAFPVALTLAFLLNKIFIFSKVRGSTLYQYVRFALVNLIALAQVWLVSVGMARWILPALAWEWHADTVAHTIGVLSPVVTSYIAHARFTFADEQQSASG